MYEQKIRKVMGKVANKELKVDDAIKKLKFMPFEDIGFAKLDHHRALRKGFPEVIYCQHKTAEQVVGIVKKMAEKNADVLATRASEEMFNEVKKHFKEAKYNKISKTIIIQKNKKANRGGILVLSAGTSDMPVAEEAAVAAEAMGNKVE
ncbi:1-(5-phosphoribosyl)-5-amino-4-imidazole-carboxylate carboxylase, partial [Candidatus Woesearchaeota archaeon]|nr:1-(5-phosphoribosyl)-5-amino-4-imidazole-carboxylate carboxylase [Candidatus Woesearchaeota archaeon]